MKNGSNKLRKDKGGKNGNKRFKSKSKQKKNGINDPNSDSLIHINTPIPDAFINESNGGKKNKRNDTPLLMSTSNKHPFIPIERSNSGRMDHLSADNENYDS